MSTQLQGETIAVGADHPPKRLPLLDVLRGIAIIGTLASNIWIFTGPGSEGALLSNFESTTAGDPLEFIFRLVSNGKFLSTLTILFGVGLAIQFESARKRGRKWPGGYTWRATFLFVEGAVHFVFVFAFDVLMGYAVIALIVAVLLNRTARTRRVIMWTAGILHVVTMAGLTVVLWKSSSNKSTMIDPELAGIYGSGSWLDQVTLRLNNLAAFRMEPVMTFWLLLLLFLTGVALFRAGAFGNDAKARRIRARMMAWGFGLGLPVNLVTSLGGANYYLIDRYIAAPVLALGLMGAVGWLVERFTPGPIMLGLSSLGRTALSGYVLQNLLATVCCYGFGLGLATLLGDGTLWKIGLWAVISLSLVLGATAWLRRFPTGPLEMVQRRILRRS